MTWTLLIQGHMFYGEATGEYSRTWKRFVEMLSGHLFSIYHVLLSFHDKRNKPGPNIFKRLNQGHPACGWLRCNAQ